jgi:putative acetyltransferase
VSLNLIVRLIEITMNIRIRDEKASDLKDIQTVTERAFLTAEHSSHTEHFIVDALRDSGNLTVSLVAEVCGEIVGHVGVSVVSITGHVRGWYGLGPVSVVPERQRQGIGALLVNQALERLQTLGANGCVVLGNPDYYSRFGFKSEPKLVLPSVPPAYFQVVSFGGSVPNGTVSYNQAFDVVA